MLKPYRDMACVERGSGMPLVMVHGALSDFRSFERQMAAFGERHRAIALSLRHYYPERWDGDGDDFSIQQHAADVAAFIRALDAGPVHLLGHSRGGNVALHVAKAHIDLLRTLILADASGLDGVLPESADGKSPTALGNEMRVRVRERFEQGDIDGGLQMYIDFASGPGRWKAAPESMRRMFRDNAWTVLGDFERPTTTRAEAAGITVPTLLVNGQTSPPRFSDMAQHLQRCLADCERVVIPKAGHGMFHTNAAATNAAVLAFLERH